MLASEVKREPRQLDKELQLEGIVIRGFGRGGKQLDCPTANIPIEAHEATLQTLSTGIYYGEARVDSSVRYPAVISIGWNPHFQNDKKTIEAHILQKFREDFYGSKLTIYVQGFLRDEHKFHSIEDLKQAIHDDIATARNLIVPVHY